MTALGIASSNGYLETAELLLERGANTNVRNGFGQTPRQAALASQHHRIAELLSKHDHS
jgi:ankyrin repeat protein